MAERTEMVCDRCGKPVKRGTFPFVRLNSCIKVTAMFGHGSYDYNSSEFDLCASYSRAFYRFMRHKEAELSEVQHEN